jgi:large subunit ribosomal protein L16
MAAGELTSRQIEAARRAMTRAIKRGGKVWIRVFPHTPITRKAAEVPMGSGKGSVEFYVARVKPGKIIFEMGGIPETLAREALKLADAKLPIKTKIVLKH